MASSELLSQIQAGRRLRKAETNDRSAPSIDTPKTGGGGPSSSVPAISASSGAPPQLGSLFAGGMPKLKPAGQSNLAKPPNLGRPPTVPKSTVSGAEAPTRPVPTPKASVPTHAKLQAPVPPKPSAIQPRVPSSASAPPARTAPTLPLRSNPASHNNAPPPPRRPPPQMGHAAPQSTPPRAIPARSASPARSSVSRPIPAIPPRQNANGATVHSPNRPAPSLPARIPPPPPRPSAAPISPARSAPPPPARKAPISKLPAHSSRVRALSEAGSSDRSPSPEGRVSPINRPPPAPPRTKSPPVSSRLSHPNRAPPATGRPPPPRRKIPSPPPNAGIHTFPVTDFPPPRDFTLQAKYYASGSQQGSAFDLGVL